MATERVHAALAQLRARLACIFVVVGVVAAVPLEPLYYVSYDIEKAGVIVNSRGSLLDVIIQYLILPAAIFSAIIPRYLFPQRTLNLYTSLVNYRMLGILSYIVAIALSRVTHNRNLFLFFRQRLLLFTM
jgi:hypothetical protein